MSKNYETYGKRAEYIYEIVDAEDNVCNETFLATREEARNAKRSLTALFPESKFYIIQYTNGEVVR